MMRAVPIALLALLLGACSETLREVRSSVAGGECRAFDPPPYALAGRTQYDQDQVDKYVETGVAACGWSRPAPRPAELERRPAPAPAASRPTRRGLVARIRQRLMPSPGPAAAPSWPSHAAPIAPVPEPPKPAPPAPRRLIDQLLYPEKDGPR